MANVKHRMRRLPNVDIVITMVQSREHAGCRCMNMHLQKTWL